MGATITDSDLNNANLALPAPASANDLLHAADLTIDTVAPSVAITRVNGATVQFPYLTTHAITSIGGVCGTHAGDEATVTVTVNSASTTPGTANCVGGVWTLTFTTPFSAPNGYVFRREPVGRGG